MANVLSRQKSAGAELQKVPFVVRGLTEAHEVRVTGDFCQWSNEGILLKRDLNGAWRGELLLKKGEHPYRLRVDGGWRDHAEAVKRIPNPFGTQNCILPVL